MDAMQLAAAAATKLCVEGEPCLEHSPTPGKLCGYTCTRALDHDGPHVAHGPDGRVFAAWMPDDARTTEF